MNFVSIEFLLFLPIVFLIYWFVVDKNVKLQNAFLIIASYFFYGWWDWRFLILLLFSSLIDFFVGYGLSNTDNPKTRKLLVTTSIISQIGLLAFFKYFNFFVDSFANLVERMGYEANMPALRIILPVGISFYTFQTLSYTIDVYRKKIEPTKDIILFLAFVSFFPQLVAGPIERASNMLPQFSQRRKFNRKMANDGLKQILWGLFKKVVIANNCAKYVDAVFGDYASFRGSTLVLAAVLFAFQIYCDFSGYTDMAIGLAKLFGFKFNWNFNYPYFSRDIAEFWRRWHISLTTWFRDYVYIPLGGNRNGKAMTVVNTFIIFLLSGLWHGANWTFVAWGFINALYFMPLLLLNKTHINTKNNVAEGRMLPGFKESAQMLTTFALTTFAWIFFRSDTIGDVYGFLKNIVSPSLLSIPENIPSALIIIILLFLVAEWFQRSNKHVLDFKEIRLPVSVRWSLYYGILLLLIWFGGGQQDFIYFRF